MKQNQMQPLLLGLAAVLVVGSLIGVLVLGPKTDQRQGAEEPAASSVEPEPVPEPEAESTAPAEEKKPRPAMTVKRAARMKAGSVLTKKQIKAVGADALFYSREISDKVFARMEGVSFGEGCVTPREELRYLRVLHMGFDGKTHIGELVCHRDLAEEMLEIFRELYEQKYPVEKILLVDEYDGDDERSMEDNNTSCFNFRPVEGTDHLSMHAYGRAIDVNPLYNPYVTADGYYPVNSGDYLERWKDLPYKIDENDLCCRLFTEHGFTWGGTWNSVKDYQHFQRKAE